MKGYQLKLGKNIEAVSEQTDFTNDITDFTNDITDFTNDITVGFLFHIGNDYQYS